MIDGVGFEPTLYSLSDCFLCRWDTRPYEERPFHRGLAYDCGTAPNRSCHGSGVTLLLGLLQPFAHVCTLLNKHHSVIYLLHGVLHRRFSPRISNIGTLPIPL